MSKMKFGYRSKWFVPGTISESEEDLTATNAFNALSDEYPDLKLIRWDKSEAGFRMTSKMAMPYPKGIYLIDWIAETQEFKEGMCGYKADAYTIGW